MPARFALRKMSSMLYDSNRCVPVCIATFELVLPPHGREPSGRSSRGAGLVQ